MVKIGGRDDATEHYLKTVDEDSDPYELMTWYFNAKADEKEGRPSSADQGQRDRYDTNRGSMKEADERVWLRKALKTYVEEHGHAVDGREVQDAVKAIEQKIADGAYNAVEDRFQTFAEQYSDEGEDYHLIDVVQDGLESIAQHDTEHEYTRSVWGEDGD